MDQKKTVVLDLGNVLNPHADKVINQIKHKAFVQAIEHINCRAMGIGPLDFSGSRSFLNQKMPGDMPPFIAANLKGPERLAPFIKKYDVIKVNGIKLGITGFIPALSKNMIKSEYTILEPEKALKEILPELKKNSDFIVLLSQSRMKETIKLIDNLKAIDIGLCIDTSSLVSLGQPSSLKVMNVVTRAQELGIIEIEKNMGKTIIKDARRIRLSKDVPSDSQVAALVADAEKKIDEHKKMLRHRQKQKEAIENLKMTPEEFIKSYNKDR